MHHTESNLIEINNKIKSKINSLALDQYNPKIIETLGNDMNISTGVMDPLGAYIDAGPSMYSDLINGIANSIKDCH